MPFFSYGKVLARLPDRRLRAVYPGLPEGAGALARAYLRLFGFPDLGGHLRFPRVLEALEPGAGELVLDAGCGVGVYAATVGALHGCRVAAVELHPERAARAAGVLDGLGLPGAVPVATLDRLPFARAAFDKVMCLEVLEHVVDDRLALSELARVLRPGGRLVLSVPGKAPGWSHEDDEAEYRDPDPYEHVRSGYSGEELAKLLAGAGFALVAHRTYRGAASRIAGRIQTLLYRRRLDALLALVYPLLALLAGIDRLRREDPATDRGHLVVAARTPG
jgi:SAM-dependent methyltransferase